MRKYIFTENERRILNLWLEEGVETQSARDLFTKIRVNITELRKDLQLMNRVGRRLQREKRWWGRFSGKSEMGRMMKKAGRRLGRRV